MAFDIFSEKPKFGSVWMWEHWEKYNDRSLAYGLRAEWEECNIMTDEGLTYLLDSALSQGAQKSGLYVVLFSGEYTPLANDTYQSPGYTEAVNYDGSRPAWQEAGVSANSLTNVANKAVFVFNDIGTINGGSLVSASTKGDVISGEVLLCSSAYQTEVNVADEDIVNAVVQLTGYST